MSYIGRTPTVGNFQICDAISTVNNQAAYTMQVGSVNVLPETANHMIVSLNGVIQKPNSSYTVAGAVITFSSALVTGDVINFIQILGDVLDLGVPSDGTVTSAKLATNAVTTVKITDANVTTAKITDNAITLAKMASGTDGNIISYDASGNPVAVATGNDGQVLTSTGAGSPPVFETLAAGADMEHISTITATIGSGSNVNSVDFSGVFTTTYKHYRLIANNIFGNTASLLQIKLQIGGSYNTSNYYVGVDSVYAYADTQSTEVARGWNAGFYNIHPNYSISNVSNPSMIDTMFYAPKDSTRTILNTQFMLNYNNLTATVTGNSSLLHNSASSVTGFQIYLVSGQIGGTFSLYGIKN